MGIGWFDDETVLAGPTQDGTGLALVWLGPDGRAVSHPATSGPVVAGGGDQVTASAVQFDKSNGESAATFFVAWIENVPERNSQRLSMTKVSCSVAGDGG